MGPSAEILRSRLERRQASPNPHILLLRRDIFDYVDRNNSFAKSAHSIEHRLGGMNAHSLQEALPCLRVR